MMTGWGTPDVTIERILDNDIDDTITYTKTSDGQKATLAFPGFDILDHRINSEYRFPSGHVSIIIYDDNKDPSSPFIEERYTHPFLLEADTEHQYLSYNESESERKMQLLARAEMILRKTSVGIRNVLTLLGTRGFNPVHDLDEQIFDRYLKAP